ncbi:putative deleted in malignant brain tumors 1 protein-like isoform X5 [Apostichopus japonicus]|uniref:Putative deleted in malignant brain tumors 1 protein-like isoform X5 n=1 Tax=Stichopus japonicus TaxID=307972 RepID=A0A2G8JU25_STIJA|nr:putative deleted in malignant brain tumors 1 protein-like isoform X5 [Apostichopus japonicus]
MAPLYVGIVVFMLAVGVEAADQLPDKCTVEWEIDWSRQPPELSMVNTFDQPGEIIAGKEPVTFSGLLEFVGLLWNANSPLEVAGFVCKNYGPYINALLDEEMYGSYSYGFMTKNMFKAECNEVVSSLRDRLDFDIYEDCISSINGFESQITDLVRNMVAFDEICPNFDENSVNLDFIELECSLLAIAMNNIFDLADKASQIAFSQLDWLGPSAFSSDLYGFCSEFRLLSTMQIDDILDQWKAMETFLAASALEYFDKYNGCGALDDSILQIIDKALFSDQKRGLCDSLGDISSAEDYKDLAADIAGTLFSAPVDKEQCLNVLEFVDLVEVVDSDNALSIHEQIKLVTSFDLSAKADRHVFCTWVTRSLSSEYQYTPSAYFFPAGEDLSSWTPFVEPGVILPDFTFTDAVDVLGAFFRSNTLEDGADVLCTVLERFLMQLSGTNYAGLVCDAFRADDTARVEYLCRDVLIQYYGSTDSMLPSLRVLTLWDLLVIQVDMVRKLFNLQSVNLNEVCQAEDDFYKSDNNLQTIITDTLSAYAAEVLPIVNDICNDYDSVIEFLKSNSYLNDDEFADHVDGFSQLILTHVGFANRNDLCKKISSGVSASTGRAEDELTSFFVQESLRFLTDERRCVDVIEKASLIMREITGEHLAIYMYQVTGYDDAATLCHSTASFFEDVCAGET